MGRTTNNKNENKNNNKKIKNVIALTLTIVALWLFIASIITTTTAATATAAVTVVTVKVDPSTQVVVTAGAPFSVAVVVENVTEMGADQATLHFDPNTMSVSQVTEGDFLKSAGTTLGAGLENINNANGQVTFFYCLTKQGSGITGSGTLATVSFTTDPSSVSGMFDLYLTGTMLVNGTGSLIPVDTIANGTCTISGPEPTPTTAPSSGGGGDGNDGGISDNTGVQPQNNTPEPEPTSSPTTPKPTSTVVTPPPPTSTVVTPPPTSTATSTPTPSKEGGAPETEGETEEVVVGFGTLVVTVALAVTYFVIKRRR